jgi:xanthine dehydrogenase accessory factor
MNAEILHAALCALKAGETFALVSVLEVDGSSPASPGQKMLVYPDGRTEGTVGGGSVELRAREEAVAMVARGRGGVLRLRLDASAPDGVDSLCGGTAVLGVEVAIGGPRVLLCGAGHVAYALARILVELGLVHGVVDPRPEQANAERYPHAATVTAEAPPDWIARTGLAGWSHLVILTHGHALDGATLRAVWEAGFAGYIGMIGSKRKWVETRRALAASGVAEDWLARVHCPVGLPIGARTPAQIAVSIAAQILQQSSGDPAEPSRTP